MLNWKKHLTWFVPVVLATGLGATQLPTSFDLIGYNFREYDCWKDQATFNKEGLIPQNTEYYANYREIKGIESLTTEGTCTGYLIEVAHTFTALDDADALFKAKKLSNGAGRLYSGNSKTHILKGKQDIAVIPYSLFSTALAAVPVHDFEDGTDGADVNGNNGGTGWDSQWGAGGTSCATTFDFTTTNPSTGLVAVKASTSGGSSCGRPYTAISTDPTEFTISMRSPVTNLRMVSYVWSRVVVGGPDAIVQIQMGSNGQIRTLDDTTLQNLVAYSADTWYTATAEVTYSTEKERIKISGGATVNYGDAPCNPNCNVANSTFYAWVSSDEWRMSDTDDVTVALWDDIGPAATVATPPRVDDTNWFMILWNYLINPAYAFL